MLTFTNNLEREVDKKIKKIMSADVSIIKKSYDASELLVNAFSQLRNFIVHYSFKDSAEEIYFFKNIKPRIFHKLLYYRKIYNIEMNRPLGKFCKSTCNRRSKICNNCSKIVCRKRF